MRKQTLELCHCLPLSGHMGQIKTVIKLKQHVLWYGMARDCKLCVKSCKICNKNKKSTKHHSARLGQYHAGVPMERIHMDILGPLPVTRQKNKYILMVIDQFTKSLECYPIPNQTAETVATVLIDDFIARYGCPLELHTDQGRNMDGNLVRQIRRILQIQKTRTTHPASNRGQIERYNNLISHGAS
jgi:transposase InsO family protein